TCAYTYDSGCPGALGPLGRVDAASMGPPTFVSGCRQVRHCRLLGEAEVDDVAVVARDDQPVAVAHRHRRSGVLARALGQLGVEDCALTPAQLRNCVAVEGLAHVLPLGPILQSRIPCESFSTLVVRWVFEPQRAQPIFPTCSPE